MDLMLIFSLSSAKVKCFSDTTKFYWKFLCNSGKYMYLCTRFLGYTTTNNFNLMTLMSLAMTKAPLL